MNVNLFRILVVLVTASAFGIVLGFGCTVGFDPTSSETGAFSCGVEDDCLPGFECINNICRRPTAGNGSTCIDNDGDGYGVGDTSQCPRCVNCRPDDDPEICCAEDCNDNNPDIYPGAPEGCTGFDNSCSGEIDDYGPCTSTSDCGRTNNPDVRFSCTNGQCQAVMLVQICNPPRPDCPCNANPLTCQEGQFLNVPDPDECR